MKLCAGDRALQTKPWHKVSLYSLSSYLSASQHQPFPTCPLLQIPLSCSSGAYKAKFNIFFLMSAACVGQKSNYLSSIYLTYSFHFSPQLLFFSSYAEGWPLLGCQMPKFDTWSGCGCCVSVAAGLELHRSQGFFQSLLHPCWCAQNYILILALGTPWL